MITTAIILAIAPLLIVTAFFSLELAAGMFPLDAVGRSSLSPSVAIVIPAHEEESVIARTLRQLNAAVGEEVRILVVADNCSDATAERARAEGAEVVERTDPGRRGKGYALAFAVEQLESSPPQVLVVLDADCAIDGSSLSRIADAAAEGGRPCQAVNLLRPDRDAPPLVQISGFAFMLKNLVRQRGLQRLSGRVHLTGTGMAIPYPLLSSSLLASGDIVEDLSLGLELASRGYAARLVPNALVVSNAASAAGTLVQRRRWEGGFIATAWRRAPPLMREAVRNADLPLLLAALDLMVPPLALLAFVNLCVLATVGGVIGTLGLSWAPVALQSFILVLAALLVLLAWAREGREFVSLRVLAGIPIYVAWKLPLYLSLARRGAPREWLRTRR